MIDYTDIANRVQEITGRAIYPSTVKIVLECAALSAQPRQASAPVSPRDWQEDASHENGDYECACATCGGRFVGHKRRVVCRVCAKPASAPVGVEGLHPETADLVRRFAQAIAEKLAAAERKYGWDTHWKSPAWMDQCREQLVAHVAKGDPRDVAAYAAFLWHHGERTALTQQPQQDEVSVWKAMDTAPKDGTAFLALFPGSDIPTALRYGGAAWHTALDGSRICELSQPRKWMRIPDDGEGFTPVRVVTEQPQQDELVSVQEAWEWAGGNPGIKATRDDLKKALIVLDEVCDEAGAHPPQGESAAILRAVEQSIPLLNRIARRIKTPCPNVSVEVEQIAAMLVTGVEGTGGES